MGRKSQSPSKQNSWTVFLNEFALTSGKEKGDVMGSAREKWHALSEDKKAKYKQQAVDLNNENGFQ